MISRLYYLSKSQIELFSGFYVGSGSSVANLLHADESFHAYQIRGSP